MRLGSLRRYAMITVAASSAAVVTLSTTAASSAPAATLRHHHMVTQTQTPGTTFTYDTCLFHHSNYCLAMQSTTHSSGIVLRSIKTKNALIEKWQTIHKPGSLEFKKVGGPSAGNGLCIGAWGYNKHIALGSCTDHHGVYWQAQDVPTGGLYLYNTYTKAYLTTNRSPSNGAAIWVHSLGTGSQDWFGYSY